MKNTMCLALIILAVLPASAQNASRANCSTSDDAEALAHNYASGVDGLLREVHASLQKISVRTEAGELTPAQARELKLAATRDMIARLDTVSAVYDVRLDCTDKGSDAANESASNNARRTAPHANNTVSVEELKREGTAAATTSSSSIPSAEGAAR